MLRIAVSLLTLLGLSQAHSAPQLVERFPHLSPESRLRNVSSIKLLGGALAAGAGLSLIKNYWNRPTPAPSTSSSYYSPGYSQYYFNNRYPSYYQLPTSNTFNNQNNQYYSHHRPSSLYYVKPYSPQYQNNYHQQNPQQPPQQYYSNQKPSQQYYSNQQPPQQYFSNQEHPQQYYSNQEHPQQYYNNQQLNEEQQDQSSLEQRIMEDEGLYTIGMMELPVESRRISGLVAGGAGLAAGYYLANKYTNYKNNKNKFSSYKKYYPVYRPHQNYHYQSYYRPSYPPPLHYQSYRPATSYQGRSGLPSASACHPVLVFSYKGNHLYKCRG